MGKASPKFVGKRESDEGIRRKKERGWGWRWLTWINKQSGRLKGGGSCYVLCGEIDPPWHTDQGSCYRHSHNHSSNEVAANKPALRLTQSTMVCFTRDSTEGKVIPIQGSDRNYCTSLYYGGGKILTPHLQGQNNTPLLTIISQVRQILYLTPWIWFHRLLWSCDGGENF